MHEVNKNDLLVTVQYNAGKLWLLACVWISPDMNPPHAHYCRWCPPPSGKIVKKRQHHNNGLKITTKNPRLDLISWCHRKCLKYDCCCRENTSSTLYLLIKWSNYCIYVKWQMVTVSTALKSIIPRPLTSYWTIHKPSHEKCINSNFVCRQI